MALETPSTVSAAVVAPDSPVSAPPSLSTARLLARPRFTPNRLMPAPIPLAVATGSVTALAAPLPMSTTAPPAEARNTWLLETSCSAAIARISSIRVASSDRPSAVNGPKSDVRWNS